jgi:hypothetical protein
MPAVCAVVLALSGTATSQVPVSEADRYIKLGTRTPDVPAGEGGELQIVADPRWCREPNDVLEVRLATRTGFMPAVRLLTGSVTCSWSFDRMPVGQYDAVILSGEHDHVLAIGHGMLARGTTAVITVESAETEIEGRLTSSQTLPSPLRLKFTVGPSNQWTTRVGQDGTYHVKVGEVGDRTTLAVWAEPDGPIASESTAAFNAFHVKSTVISRGLVHLDLEDVNLPPVVVNIEVPAILDARFDAFAEALFDGVRGPGFKLRNGLRGQALAEYGTHTIQVLTNDRQQVLATAVVTANPPTSDVRVALNVRRLR